MSVLLKLKGKYKFISETEAIIREEQDELLEIGNTAYDQRDEARLKIIAQSERYS